jgi:hypothetical protein
MERSGSLLKQDVRGRVRTPLARREALLDEFERSGLSGPKFAALVGVKYQTLAWWICERRKRRALTPEAGDVARRAGASSSLRLVEAVVADDETKMEPGARGGAADVLQVHLGGGVRLEIGDAAQVKLAVSLIKALGMERSC